MSMPTPIHFRTDSWHESQMRLKNDDKTIDGWDFYSFEERNRIKVTPLPKAGDTWRVRWYRPVGEEEGPVAGYAICCPKCGDIHAWTTAINCTSPRENGSCSHSGTGSCWTWTGSAEDGTLTANPSLLVVTPECGYHGWLQNGVLSDG